MSQQVPSLETPKIETLFSQAWHFLSGGSRTFVHSACALKAIEVSDFTFLISILNLSGSPVGGVGLFIQRPDALSVAVHTFGMDIPEITDNDLLDCCAEVCNLFSGCVTSTLHSKNNVTVGVPFNPDSDQLKLVVPESPSFVIYQSHAENSELYVVVYGDLN